MSHKAQTVKEALVCIANNNNITSMVGGCCAVVGARGRWGWDGSLFLVCAAVVDTLSSRTAIINSWGHGLHHLSPLTVELCWGHEAPVHSFLHSPLHLSAVASTAVQTKLPLHRRQTTQFSWHAQRCATASHTQRKNINFIQYTHTHTTESKLLQHTVWLPDYFEFHILTSSPLHLCCIQLYSAICPIVNWLRLHVPTLQL